MLETLVTSLRALDDATLPENKPGIDEYMACIEKPFQWLFGDTDPLSPLEQQALISHHAWTHHIWTIVQTVIPAWAFGLGHSSPYRRSLDATLLGCIHAQPTANTNVTMVMVQVSLPILLECLQTEKTASFETLDIYMQIIRQYTMPPLLSIYIDASTTVDDIRYLCTNLCSIPLRVANAVGFQSESFTDNHDWYLESNFYSNVSKNLANTLLNLASKTTGNQDKASDDLLGKRSLFAGELLGKMIRQGHKELCIATLYPMVRTQMQLSDRVLVSHLGQLWPAVWERSENVSVKNSWSEALLEYICKSIEQQDHEFLPCSTIQAAATDASTVLFGTRQTDNRQKVLQLLSFSVFTLSKTRWANATSLRLCIAICLHALGLEKLPEASSTETHCWQLSETATQVLSEFMTQLIDAWTDPVFIGHGTYHEQEYISMAILVITAYLSKQQMEQFFSGPSMMYGITRWFDSGDVTRCKLVAVIAETISSIVDKENGGLNVGILNAPEDQRYLDMKQLVTFRDALVQNKTPDAVDMEQVPSPEPDTIEQDMELDPDAVVVVEDDESDSSSDESDLVPYAMEEESDDEGQYTVEQKSKRDRAKTPAYIYDLLACLKDTDDPIKMDLGLKTAAQLIRQKTGIGAEIQEHAVELAERLVGLHDVYHIDNFNQKQQDALIALEVALPEIVTRRLIDRIYDRNTSDAQKMLIFSVITLSVRELANLERDPDYESIKAIMNGDNKQLEDTAALTPRIGQVTWSSRRAQVTKKREERNTANRLSGLAGPVFFFPLLVGWWEGSQGRTNQWIGNHKILAERFVMTLVVIMHCATNTPDKRRIVTEFFDFAFSLRYANVPRTVTRALLMGIDVILNVSYYGQERLLVQDYVYQLTKLKDWLQDLLELVNEDEIKDMAIKHLARLAQIAAA